MNITNIFKDRDIVIHTPTLEDYFVVVRDALDNGASWSYCLFRNTVKRQCWIGEDTCVHIKHNILYYDRIRYYISIGYNIMTVDEFCSFSIQKYIHEYFK